MHNNYMKLAFEQAKIAFFNNEVPIGAIIVKDGEILGTGYNKKENLHKCTAHAEIIAIEEATKKLNNWRLDGCEMYVTLEPCPMCASAIKQSRISTVYAALSNSDKNNSQILGLIFKKDNINPAVKFYNNINPQLSKDLLNDFFKKQRNS